jgi:hypothetical protein
MENAEKYPEKVRDILYKDIFQRGENDPVRLAYELAVKMHEGEKRKGKDALDYITHPLQVYDMVKKCIGDDPVIDKDLTLAAALLHDAVEDAPKKSAGIKEVARMNAVVKIQGAFINLVNKGNLNDSKFPDKLVHLLTELTNPVEVMDSEKKRAYQVGKARTAQANVNLIKICDQTLNVISNIEERPLGWDYRRLIDYTNKATAVVKAAVRSIDESDKHKMMSRVDPEYAEYAKEINASYTRAVKLAGRVYSDVSDAELEILKNMRTAGKMIPPENPVATFSMEQLVDNARRDGGKIHGFSR